jgi:hypothetical protein
MSMRRQADVARCLAFGAGAATSLILSLIVLALTVSPARAGTTSVVSALLTVALVAWRADLGPTQQSDDHSKQRTRCVGPNAQELHVGARPDDSTCAADPSH